MTKPVSMRLRCTNAHLGGVRLEAVADGDEANPNNTWSQATPYALLQATVNNPNVEGFFEEGAVYEVIIARRPEGGQDQF